MKYRSISLNGNKHRQYNLVKYNDDYKYYLKELRKMNKSLADLIEICPKIYSELSEHQSYMIFEGIYACVGAINIETSTDEKNLEIEVELNEKHFDSQGKIIMVIEQLIESLKLYFFDKENIEINLINDIDLSKFNPYEYQKKIYDEKLTTYICSNKLNNELIPKLVDEIISLKKNLTIQGQHWQQDLEEKELYYGIDDALMEEIYKGTITLPELFFKVKTLLWSSIDSAKSTMSTNFSRDGYIVFTKKSPDHLEGINYEFSYNILRDGFNLKIDRGLNNILEIDENSYFTNIKTNQLNILYLKEDGSKRIKYISQIVDKSSVSLELWINEQEEIERCYIDFQTHKGNGKINGLYALRIFSQYNQFTLKFISRKGNHSTDFASVLSSSDKELYSTIINGKITIELVNELIHKVIPIVNRKVTKSNNHNNNRQYIADVSNTIISNAMLDEVNAINLVKQIQGEILLPHLQENLEKFINEDDKRKVLK